MKPPIHQWKSKNVDLTMISWSKKIFAVLPYLLTGVLYAQPLEYRVTVGGRGAGLGESSIALQPSPLSIYYNPAALGFMQQGGALVDYSNLFGAGVYEGVVAVASPLPLPYGRDRQFGFGMMVNFEGFDDSELRYGRYIVSAAAGLPLSNRLAFGANFKIALINAQQENVSRESVNGSGTGLDLSLHYRLPFTQQSLVRQIDLAAAAYDVYDTWVTYQPENNDDLLFERAVRTGAAIHFRDFLSRSSFALRSPTLLLQLDDRWHLGGEVTLFNLLALRAGYAHDIGKPGESVLTFGFGLDLDERAANVQFDYAYVHPGFLPDRHLFTISAPMFKGPPPVAITTPEIAPIFASYYKSYPFSIAAQHNSIRIENLTNTTIAGQFVLAEAPFGITIDEATATPLSLQPGERRTVRLPLVMTNDILEARGLSQPVQAKLRFEYTTPNSSKRRQFDKSITLVIHGRNFLVWDELAREAAFITPEDRLVQKFREEATFSPDDPFWQRYSPIYRAAQFYEALVENGVAYLRDTELKFDSLYASQAFDRVKYPGELLAAEGGSRRGDCDDLVALYCSLLESDNIATALVGTSDHLLMLFDTGLHPSRQAFLPLPDSLLFQFSATGDVGLDDRIWLPVEVTAIGRSADEALPFDAAIIQGATYIREAQRSDSLFEIASTLLAQRKFPAEQNPPVTTSASVVFKEASGRTRMALSGLDRLRKSYESAILEKAKEASEDGFAAGLRYATLASYAEWHEIADSILEKLAENFAERYELLNNQGNLEFLLENYERAGQLYDKALQQKPDFIQGYLNRILLHKAMIENNFGHADSLNQAIGRDSLAVVKLYNSQYRDAGISLARLQGFAILEETGRGKAQGREKSATKDSLGTERKPLKVKERTLINKTKDFFTKLGQYLSPPDPRPRVKYVAAGRGSSPVLQATRLVELLYWSTPQIYSSLRAERSNL